MVDKRARHGPFNCQFNDFSKLTVKKHDSIFVPLLYKLIIQSNLMVEAVRARSYASGTTVTDAFR